MLNAESSAIPVFLMSGLAGLRGAWGNQYEAFTRRGPVVLHDHRGTGKSAKPLGVYSIENMAADMVAIMDTIGAEKAHFIGNSTGVAIAQVLCIDHPGRVQSAVICSSWAKDDHLFTRTFEMRKIILLELGKEVYTRDSSITLMGQKIFQRKL